MKMKQFLITVMAAILLTGCPNASEKKPISDTGVKKATASIDVGSDGLTVEQRNVRDRLQMDNSIGSIKHLYIISAYSGQTIVYSTVKGKVTSSGKRLTPKTVTAGYIAPRAGGSWSSLQPYGMKIQIGDRDYYTNEVIQDDGTYGDSIDYLYWWDVQGRYHQQYITGGMIVHVSDQPIRVKDVIINMEMIATAESPLTVEDMKQD